MAGVESDVGPLVGGAGVLLMGGSVDGWSSRVPTREARVATDVARVAMSEEVEDLMAATSAERDRRKAMMDLGCSAVEVAVGWVGGCWAGGLDGDVSMRSSVGGGLAGCGASVGAVSAGGGGFGVLGSVGALEGSMDGSVGAVVSGLYVVLLLVDGSVGAVEVVVVCGSVGAEVG